MHKGKYLDKISDEEGEELRLMRGEARIPNLGAFTQEIEDLIKS